MSKATQSALDDAIRAHIAELEHGSLVGGYVLVAASIPRAQGDAIYYPVITPEDQPSHIGLGLAYQAVDHYRSF
jgi:hypothetical protein